MIAILSVVASVCHLSFYVGNRASESVASENQGLHSLFALKPKPFRKCQFCDYKVQESKHLMQHYKAFHKYDNVSASSGVQCPECGIKFSDVNALLEHHRSCIEHLECNICGKILSSRANTLRHMKTVHSVERKFSCSYCNTAFKHKWHLKDHLVHCKYAPKIQFSPKAS